MKTHILCLLICENLLKNQDKLWQKKTLGSGLSPVLFDPFISSDEPLFY